MSDAHHTSITLESYWSKLNGDSEITWGPDPLLTPTGIDQAREARAAWKKEIPFGVPVPHRHYASPLKRALDTWKIVFVGDSGQDSEGILSEEERRVVILEVSSSYLLIHTCLILENVHAVELPRRIRRTYM